MERFVIDTDPGVDDAHAIMMAGAHPNVQIEALTVVAGNVGLPKTVANACLILDALDEDAPVFAGCETPLIPGAVDAAHVHGEDGLGDAGFEPSQRVVESEHAAAALVRMAQESPGELTLVAIGPLTNLAVALKLDPGLPARYKRLVIMGGAENGRGNTPTWTSEFNIYSDPEAAHIVFSNWPALTMVSWEATMANSVPMAMIAQWQAMETPRSKFFSRVFANTLDFIVRNLGRTSLPAADGLAMAVAIEPEIVQSAEKRYVTVELNGQHSRGQTVVDWMGRSGLTPNTTITGMVDPQRFRDLLTLAMT